MKFGILLVLVLFFSSCSWLAEEEPAVEESTVNEKTAEEEFKENNAELFEDENEAQRKEYLKSMRSSQESGQFYKDDKVTNYALVTRKMSRQEYERIRAQAELGDEDACIQMAQIHKYGYYGAGPNLALTKKWLENAADLGSVKARLHLKHLEKNH
ncbi:hypothetical protein PQO03_08995 [Lentisphaera profundi]|uniref:Sel1 repeat family protein n=1 Tax=Lentisphaera profundi TaxID=1658616 RepID=A0ABY7VPU9_9BACT|nr:hypothetical protein [Lentisphaera profundi]WDE95851.1 hypothetical protein PQO03_08995 [Lentisphaera profundi]